jgi:hypothetical protein
MNSTTENDRLLFSVGFLIQQLSIGINLIDFVDGNNHQNASSALCSKKLLIE